MNSNLYEEIEKLAYEIFEREGRVHGRDLDHWLEAERIVISRYEAQWLTEKEKEDKPEAEKKITKPKTKSSKVKTEKQKKTKENEKKTTRSKKKSQ